MRTCCLLAHLLKLEDEEGIVRSKRGPVGQERCSFSPFNRKSTNQTFMRAEFIFEKLYRVSDWVFPGSFTLLVGCNVFNQRTTRMQLKYRFGTKNCHRRSRRDLKKCSRAFEGHPEIAHPRHRPSLRTGGTLRLASMQKGICGTAGSPYMC
jgi:hypothetical protein